MPFFVLNSWPTLFSARDITTYYQYTQARLLKASSVLTHTQAIQHTIHVFSLANFPVHKVWIYQTQTELQLDWVQEFKTFCNTLSTATSATGHNMLSWWRERCKCFQNWACSHVLYLWKAHSPSILCTFRVATHEKSLNNEFQGGACSARQAGFDFTWTTDIRVECSHSPSAPCFAGVFHRNHTLLLLPKTHQKTEDHIFPSWSPI